ncbi:MAG: Glycerophosphoryl diester phosphodiesterase family protein [Candidatus Amesbacteria bacterium GW2011_GWA2_47_11b]|uniref:Glycerophosphoryl diester phosphodiesterase family protein n=3 Tax=Candidatus Amesiibacteriota TaxID=1752730 RepID=A0A0G1SLP7_9BACT|nr:MAG: Glycerophosphoryl diester phosphodiesterase family protein [Candidatus Curtissbacteria bacterium GW2011_GWB1_40_28]KKU29410.1 MAG: Glycerophosphoryl diester phosphodiesterase family protein [Microgenomates group bacterium GW2011_GWC1_46_20]KKU58512.1 MAG: Glycerophosphoryl diester phosphodiesterase family protein [Candidatus Amesbacteria bacterium GW2011_GWA2_47_11b]KKU70351.1 MAG: Glycerophosphoryl diester phosphodiesterase family protein [Candidatus Amesbacteria bacterium GW2011_GWA1_4
MKIFAHRGVFDKYSENSLAALKSALNSHFSVETDLRLTVDNDFAIIHEDNLQRLFRKDVPVSSQSLSQLLKVGLASFRQYCQLLKNYPQELFTAVHLKADSQTHTGLELVSQYFTQYNLFNRAFVFDLTIEAARYLRKINPKVQIAFIISEEKFEPTVYLWDEVRDLDFDIVWAAEIRNLYSQKFINTVKRTGRTFYAVSPDIHRAPEILHPRAYAGYDFTWKELIAWCVDGICTDFPYMLKRQLK